MKLEDIKSRWQADRPVTGNESESEARVMEAVKLQADRFNRKLLFRDWLETAAAVAVVAAFAAAIPTVGWLSRVGLSIVIGACIFIAWRLHSTRRRHKAVGPERPVTEVIHAEIRRIDDQVALLESILWWYISPIAVGCILAVAGMKGLSLYLLAYTVVVTGISAFIYYMNQNAVATDLKPRRERLAQMLEDGVTTKTGKGE